MCKYMYMYCTRVCVYVYRLKPASRFSPPGDLQVELHRAEVVDVHGEGLRQGAKKVQHLAGHTAHHHVVGEALQLRHLQAAQ